VLADEPTGNLDQTTAQQIADLFREIRPVGDRQSMLVVTHSLELAKRFDQQWHLDDGHLQQ
jgi:ABC-type lipoprotein export system ATPase subunit